MLTQKSKFDVDESENGWLKIKIGLSFTHNIRQPYVDLYSKIEERLTCK